MAVRPDGMIGTVSVVNCRRFVVGYGSQSQRGNHGRCSNRSQEKFRFAEYHLMSTYEGITRALDIAYILRCTISSAITYICPLNKVS